MQVSCQRCRKGRRHKDVFTQLIPGPCTQAHETVPQLFVQNIKIYFNIILPLTHMSIKQSSIRKSTLLLFYKYTYNPKR